MIVTDHKTLRQKSEPVSISEAQTIYEQLLAEVQDHKALGLSAIQIGIPKRVFICWHQNDKGVGAWYCYVNPRIISQEPTIEHGTEGCLSFPGFELRVPRFTQITIASESLTPDYDTFVLYGLDAVVFQHELDHLDGVLFFDRGIITTNPLGTGRNEPCFCGSGKKHKKCCGRGT
jgi:peptide deformylase